MNATDIRQFGLGAPSCETRKKKKSLRRDTFERYGKLEAQHTLKEERFARNAHLVKNDRSGMRRLKLERADK